MYIRRYWRDVTAAGVVLAVAAILFAGQLSNSSTGVPLIFGNPDEESTADDAWDRAGQEHFAADSNDNDPSVTRDDQPASRTELAASNTAPATLVAVPASQWNRVAEEGAPSHNSHETHDTPSVIHDQVRTTPDIESSESKGADEGDGPTPTTSAPPKQVKASATPSKSVNEMSEEEVAEAVNKFRQWIHDGEINVELDLAGVRVEQLGMVVKFFALKNDDIRIRVAPDGSSARLDATAWPEGVLLGDLNLRRSQWPDYLSNATERWFGPLSKPEAKLFLNPRGELSVYQLVATNKPRRGSHVRLRLQSSETGGVEIELDRVQ